MIVSGVSQIHTVSLAERTEITEGSSAALYRMVYRAQRAREREFALTECAEVTERWSQTPVAMFQMASLLSDLQHFSANQTKLGMFLCETLGARA
jgi:hypothetical protein